MSKKQSKKEKWISDAAYYQSLNRDFNSGYENKDWLEAEQQYNQLMKKRVKAGLVRIS